MALTTSAAETGIVPYTESRPANHGDIVRLAGMLFGLTPLCSLAVHLRHLLGAITRSGHFIRRERDIEFRHLCRV